MTVLLFLQLSNYNRETMENFNRLEKIEKTISDTNAIVRDLQEQLLARASTISRTVFDKIFLRDARDAVKIMLRLFSKREEPVVLSYEKYEDVFDIRDEVVKEILVNKSNQPWATVDILNEGFKQVWNNQRDDHQRGLTGKKMNHRASNRRNKRRTNKMKKRIEALGKSRKSPEWKERAKAVLTRDCISPDVTDDESGERLTLPIIWESQLLREVKEHLDNVGNLQQKEDHPTKFTRVKPSYLVPT